MIKKNLTKEVFAKPTDARNKEECENVQIGEVKIKNHIYCETYGISM